APVFARVRGSPSTIHHLVRQSRLPLAAYSGALRKLMRPRGLMARRVLPSGERRGAIGRLAQAINEGRVSAAPPRGEPSGPTLESIADATLRAGAVRGRRAAGRLLLALLLFFAVFAFFILPPLGALIAAVVVVATVVAAYRLLAAPSFQPAALG